MRQQPCLARLLGSAAVLALLTAGLGGCQTAGMPDITGALGARAEARASADPKRAVDIYGEQYRAHPKSVEAALKADSSPLGHRPDRGAGSESSRTGH